MKKLSARWLQENDVPLLPLAMEREEVAGRPVSHVTFKVLRFDEEGLEYHETRGPTYCTQFVDPWAGPARSEERLGKPSRFVRTQSGRFILVEA